MLSIGHVRRGESGREYYLQLHEEDYYLRKGGGEPPGQWYGRLAGAFGLRGLVGEKEFCKLFDGQSPAGRTLRQRRPNGRPAFDLTFSVPKDVSIVYALADPEMKRRIEAAVYAAVKEALRYLEEEACMTRLGRNGTEVVSGRGLAAALFLHSISRELDPQLHIHAVTFNFTQGPDGTYRSLDGSKLYEHKHAAGALFRAELASRLGMLGFEIERDRFSFALNGVPQSLKDEFSKRAEQIRRELGEEEATPKQKDGAALTSREPKRDVDRDKLMEEWREVALRYGLTTERVEELSAHGKPKDQDEPAELRAAVAEALTQIASSASSFTRRKLLEHTSVEAQTRGLSANQIRLEVWGELERARLGCSPHMVHLGRHPDGYERFTTKELFQLEKEIIQAAERGRESHEHRVSETALAKALTAKPTLKAEQVEAVRHITQSAGRVQCVSGWAGSGKTYMLDAAREAWERDGYTVYGTALSGKAAKGLSEGAHLKSATIAKWIYDLDHPGRNRLTLDSKSILVIDEAGMVGTRALHRLITEVERAGARLVLVGDDKQLQSIDAGGGFSGLSRRLGYAELKEITRQRHGADRQAVYDLAEGNAAAALQSYAARGRLILGDDLADTKRRLVADWRSDETKIEEKLILSSTNHQAAALNGLCQRERRRLGELGPESVTVGNGAEVHAGDRVLFTRNDRFVGVHNGELATVMSVTTADENRPGRGEAITVKLDRGELVTVSLSRYDRDHIRLGYCVTTHKAQGATVENAYVFSYGAMTDAQMAYVQASRARNETWIYTTRDEAGPELSDLAEVMSRSRKKTLAHDTIEEPATPKLREGRSQRLKLCHELS